MARQRKLFPCFRLLYCSSCGRESQGSIRHALLLCLRYLHGPTFDLELGFGISPVPKENRAVMIAIVSAIGNHSAIYSSRLSPTSTAPRYTIGFASVACFTGAGSVLAAVVPFGFNYLKTTGRRLRERFSR